LPTIWKDWCSEYPSMNTFKFRERFASQMIWDSHKRGSGLIVPISMLPDTSGEDLNAVGTFGDLARIASSPILSRSGISFIQLLPFYHSVDNSPYFLHSRRALNPILIDILGVIEEGDLELIEVREYQEHVRRNRDAQREDRAGYGLVRGEILGLETICSSPRSVLWRAYENFLTRGSSDQRMQAYKEFMHQADLSEYADFMALKSMHGLDDWHGWSDDARERSGGAAISPKVRGFFHYLQFVAESQLRLAHQELNDHGIQVLGDLPHLIGKDSVDEWANRDLFMQMTLGLPPKDQYDNPQEWSFASPWNWNNPDTFEKWWGDFQYLMRFVDGARIDWAWGLDLMGINEIGAPIEKVHFVPGPGDGFYQFMEERYGGKLPIWLEVTASRLPPGLFDHIVDRGYPLQKLLTSCGFGGQPKDYMPNLSFPEGPTDNCMFIVTNHDKPDPRIYATQKGREHLRESFLRYAAQCSRETLLNYQCIEAVLASAATNCQIPLWGLDDKIRTPNIPGVGEGQWESRITRTEWHDLNNGMMDVPGFLYCMNEQYHRLPAR